MIVIPYDNYDEIIHQHDHARLSGEMALHAGKAPFAKPDIRTVLVATLHDMSWRESDKQFLDEPYDFIHYPRSKKLALYTKGIDQAEKVDHYVALLTSLHYTAFFNPDGPEDVQQFLAYERKRQQRLRTLFPNENIELAHKQLKMWDNFSLYVCLNKPGVKKEEEHPWFKKGIKAVTAEGEELIVDGHWIDQETITFSPFPFTQSWTTTIPTTIHNKETTSLQKETRRITFVEN